MYLAYNNIIPPKEYAHDPKLCDTNGNTVAIILLKKKLEVPEYWRYDPEYIINYRFSNGTCDATTAYILVCHNITPPEYFYHNPAITCNYLNKTVAMRLAENKVIP